ncbi:hypothetical protein [Paenibacillus sp. LHD-38]|uniref:hypothetical protein n=1 Tax=Paenibacillus sp. LHD-38 TaxID=3072143 RepID=UPI00280E7C63|nr:hypothetical protein [Paenibacillus sp. LHD-38]MDQ8734210.1 hypothetical protein [Paenibacillus sp. LHD-38]
MEELSMEEWSEYIVEKATEFNCFYFDANEIIDVTLNIEVELDCTESNIVKLLQLAKANASPVIIQEKFYYDYEIAEAIIQPDDLRENHNYLFASLQVRRKINHLVDKHNDLINQLPRQECYTVTVSATLISGVTLGINKYNHKYEEWDDLLNKDLQITRILKQTIGELSDKEELLAKRSVARDRILDKFRNYLINHEEFKTCTNKELRRHFCYKLWRSFRDELCTKEEQELTETNVLIPGYLLDENVEVAWRYLKNGSV